MAEIPDNLIFIFCIGRVRHVAWLPHSLDLTLLNFFVCALKQKVYKMPINDLQSLK